MTGNAKFGDQEGKNEGERTKRSKKKKNRKIKNGMQHFRENYFVSFLAYTCKILMWNIPRANMSFSEDTKRPTGHVEKVTVLKMQTRCGYIVVKLSLNCQ